ncbi:MAG: pyruvate-flavodoxin oxidoreductase [Actinobacteria bacterium HGW-Actinobacteria-4]|nr:MAG: pyruvate-flavodoxin oxidoreductase [Actinobacteria bacterium HGW-Actinobacteria-4]
MKGVEPQYPGIETVINGNGAVAEVMRHVCDGVIGYPITPSTEIAELFEAARADGNLNVWGRHPFFVATEGEHSAQSGALGATLTGGQYISNASSSQGILYAIESHFVTVGKKVGGFVLQVAARVVSKHSLNVMAGHDDVYALLPSGYTIIFGSNPQEAADLAAISYRTSALSLVPVANAMDGFATSHVMSEALMPEPELLREYLGDPASRIPCPTVAQDMLFGAKGRVFQLEQYLDRHADTIPADDAVALKAFLDVNAWMVEKDNAGDLVEKTAAWIPAALRSQWRRQWLGAHEKGTRQLVPALVDIHNPGLTGPVQNQPDFQAGAVDHRTHFANAVPGLVRQAMDEYSALTGRAYSPIHTYDCDDADYIMVGMGSITDDVRAVLPHLRSKGLKVGVVSVKLLQPFPEAELAAALTGAKAVTILERSDDTALTRAVTQALFKASANANATGEQYAGIPALESVPSLTTAIFGLGGHDVQPRHLIAAFTHMAEGKSTPLIYIGSQFFDPNPTPSMAALQDRLREAYPETVAMALETEPNPAVLPPGALRIRFHSVGGYGTIATGKLLTDILAGVLGMHSKSAPKYGSEKSGAATNYYITLSPDEVLLTNAELEDVEVVISPDHKAFVHTNPLKGLVEGGTFILQSNVSPEETWRSLPSYAQRTIRDKQIRFLVVDAFTVAKKHAPTVELETRMMGIAFIGAVVGHVDRVSQGAPRRAILEKVRAQIAKKFGGKGGAVVDANMAVIQDGIDATVPVDYNDSSFESAEAGPAALPIRSIALSEAMCPAAAQSRTTGLFDPGYYEDLIARPFREGTISESPVLPGAGMFMPVGTAIGKDKGLFRRSVPIFDFSACTGCLDCALACPDAAIPNTVHEVSDLLSAGIAKADVTETQRKALLDQVPAWRDRVHEIYRADKSIRAFADVAAQASDALKPTTQANAEKVVTALAGFPVARTRPFFDSVEKESPGTGALFSAVIDPWKCTGCLECVDVCGPGALTEIDQDADVLAGLEERFEAMTTLPATPERFLEGSTSVDGDLKRIMLDRTNYYATVGGHGACRGCGEVTAIRLVTSMSRALGDKKRQAHIAELESLTSQLRDKSAALAKDDIPRRQRIGAVIAELERRLYLYEGGPTGSGPAPTVIANSTGCSSVYASTVPFTPYIDPWVNSLFQDAQPLASGIFEGISAQSVAEVRALRQARLELEDAYDPAVHDKQLSLLGWRGFTSDELSLLPTVLTIGGDGASYDIGFGAMSRVLASGTPVKMLVLNTGAYSNTGGQASTASLTGQDADLARFGGAHTGKQEGRKELGLLAAFHPNVYSCVTATALHGHFLTATMELLGFKDGAAVMDVYTPCGTENGIAENLSSARGRLAVESRMSPVFVHDPRRGESLSERFSLDGNPDPDKTWSTSTLQYVDDDGQLQLMTTPLTPAEFALGEVRFKKQFHKLTADAAADAVPIAEFVELPVAERTGKVPFVFATDDDKHLVKVGCAAPIVTLVEERRHHWRTLQSLAGLGEALVAAEHAREVQALRAQYEEAMTLRDSSLDDIARAMSELVTSSRAPAGLDLALGVARTGGAGGAVSTSDGVSATDSPGAAASGDSGAPVYLDPAEAHLCNDCGTCYQELPQFFEKTTQIIDGEARIVAHLIPGSTDNVEVTPEIAKRIARVRANCDAEIIR